MLTYKIKISSDSSEREIILDDFFASSDLSYISGTTSVDKPLSLEDKIYVKSFYFPRDEKIDFTSLSIVKRNGYVTIPQEVEIEALYYHNEYMSEYDNKPIHYINFNGNVYYQDLTKSGCISFMIDGLEYRASLSSSTIFIDTKYYIEDTKLIFNGETYNVSWADDVIFCDSEGEVFDIPATWDISNVSKKSTLRYKVVFTNKSSQYTNVNNVSGFEYHPYIVYNGERLMFSSLYDENNFFVGYGVNIDGVNYLSEYGDSGTTDLSIGNMENYAFPEYDSNNFITIKGVNYQLYIEPREIDGGDYICIETDKENLPIQIDSIITMKSSTQNGLSRVYKSGDISYCFVNGIRYNMIRNLCDQVTINNTEYDLEYIGDSSNPYSGMMATTMLDDGTMIYFMVKSVSNNRVTLLQKMNKYNDVFEPAYTVTYNTSGETTTDTIYSIANSYHVFSRDGFIINGSKYPIVTYPLAIVKDVVTEYGQFIEPDFNAEYTLKVRDVLGSNKFICEPSINKTLLSSEEYSNLVTSIRIAVSQDSSFMLYINSNLFGNRILTAKEWLGEAITTSGASSVYEISNIEENVTFIRKSNDYSLPVSLHKDDKYSLNKEDLLTYYYYADQEEKVVNDIVDLEKDIYNPVYYESDVAIPIEKITFNLHFRTRDLDTWNIFQDDGSSVSGITEQGVVNNGDKLSLDYIFSNWFITDYYPYNQYNTEGSSVYHDDDFLNKIMDKSDLLGMAYFTTNDVQVKRQKLSGSFLRLTYYDSRDPVNQNLLGTSTVYLDCDKYFDILSQSHDEINYAKVALSLCGNRIDDASYSAITDCFNANTKQAPTVLTEIFSNTNSLGKVADMSFDDGYRLDTQLNITDRYDTTTSSEGFYPYILKYVADKNHKQTIYLKAEFFHAGMGVKIPMCIATDSTKNAISSWNLKTLTVFKEGYNVNEVYERQYIPIDISYDKDIKKFVYEISSLNNFDNAIRRNNQLVFNLFEIKTQVN